ncbi:hypothetical protein EPN87_02535 [archaeon]|nr:MAG: hypothetical protein EPN87_02535 [archaeon]
MSKEVYSGKSTTGIAANHMLGDIGYFKESRTLKPLEDIIDTTIMFALRQSESEHIPKNLVEDILYKFGKNAKGLISQLEKTIKIEKTEIIPTVYSSNILYDKELLKRLFGLYENTARELQKLESQYTPKITTQESVATVDKSEKPLVLGDELLMNYLDKSNPDYHIRVSQILDFLHYAAMKEFKSQPFSTPSTILHASNSDDLLNMLRLDFAYHLGEPRDEFWDVAAGLMNEIEKVDEYDNQYKHTGYYLNVQARKLYRSLVEKEWENLSPRQRQRLASTQYLSLSEVLAIKDLLKLDESMLSEYVNDSVKQIKEKLSPQALQSLQLWVPNLEKSREEVVDNLFLQFATYLYVGGRAVETSVAEEGYYIFGLERIPKTYMESLVKHSNELKTVSPSVKADFEKPLEELLEDTKQLYRKYYTTDQEISQLKSWIARQRAKNGDKYKINEAENRLSELNAERDIAKFNAEDKLSTYVSIGGQLVQYNPVSNYYLIEGLLLNKDKVQGKMNDIGISDYCTIDLEKHMQTVRYGGVLYRAYVPIDIRSNLWLAIPRMIKGIDLVISPKSEVCGIEVTKSKQYIENLFKRFGYDVQIDEAIKLVEAQVGKPSPTFPDEDYDWAVRRKWPIGEVAKMKREGFKPDFRPEHVDLAWAIANGEVSNLTVTKSELKYALQTVLTMYDEQDETGPAIGGRSNPILNMNEKDDKIEMFVDQITGKRLSARQLNAMISYVESSNPNT